MDILAPSYSVAIDHTRGEIHFSASGRWDEAKVIELNKELLKTAKPFTEAKRPIRVLGDLREFNVQTQEIADLMRQSQEGSAALGVVKMAILCSSALVKMQFQRVSEALNLQVFENEADAVAWLREA